MEFANYQQYVSAYINAFNAAGQFGSGTPEGRKMAELLGEIEESVPQSWVERLEDEWHLFVP